MDTDPWHKDYEHSNQLAQDITALIQVRQDLTGAFQICVLNLVFFALMSVCLATPLVVYIGMGLDRLCEYGGGYGMESCDRGDMLVFTSCCCFQDNFVCLLEGVM